ncbi:hypothetical protein BKA62DRAFT_302130 [Auriculariales sp. MPI-PUGE-AT-0066]|nr:hypothetical protein BKA62DRAFT_302130 [Auriculariales sp. MPI-PUGE-AT-0066]
MILSSLSMTLPLSRLASGLRFAKLSSVSPLKLHVSTAMCVTHCSLELCSCFPTKGVGVRFMNDPSLLDNTKSTKEINDLFMQVQPMGTAMISRKLLALINDHNARSLQAQKISQKALYDVKPLNIVVLTDGDFMETPAAILRRIGPAIQITRQIETPQDVERRIGIQFVQIGNDAAATEALEALDNALPDDEDMIDTVRWEGKLTPARLYKILLGAVHGDLDSSGRETPSFFLARGI